VHGHLSVRLAEEGGAHPRRRAGKKHDAKGGDRKAKKAFAAGRLLGHEEARAARVLKKAQRDYAAFAEAKPFWT
jgi:hypothetical protein